MAVTTVLINTATLTGARATSSTHIRSITTAGTIVISTNDLRKVIIRATHLNTSTTVVLTLGVGTEFTNYHLSNATVTLATANASLGGLTANTTIIGGTDFDTSRFKTSGGTVIITVPALPLNTLYVEALTVN